MPRGSLIAVTLVATMLALAAYAHNSTGAHAGGGCHEGATRPDSTSTTVAMKANCFITTVARVDEGATVTWTNNDEVAHNINGSAFGWGAFDDVFAGEQVSFAFPQSGAYVYECTIHSGMTGAIVVGDGHGTEPSSVRAVTAAAAGGDRPNNATGNAESRAQEATSSSDGIGRTMLAVAGAVAVTLILFAAGFVLLRSRGERSHAAA